MKRRARGIRVRTGQGGAPLTKEEFTARFLARVLPAGGTGPSAGGRADVPEAIGKAVDAAWDLYLGTTNPPSRRAGRGFSDEDARLPVAWLESRRRVREAERRHRDRRAPSRVLLVCGSDRNDATCPGEASKTWRLVKAARAVLDAERGFSTEVLDLSRLCSEFGRVIHPCKACVSTAMPLCHWPCSCYPNPGLGQVNDWMADIYPMWVAAHGVMIVTPVYWYQAPGALKSMMDRLVCADGGNPDPTSTAWKDPAKAKAIEMRGWGYPKHLAGRAFSVVVHGDAAGVEGLRRAISDWLTDLRLVPAGGASQVARYVGYYRPYATSHDDLDADRDLLAEVRNAARSLAATVRVLRSGRCPPPDRDLRTPRPK